MKYSTQILGNYMCKDSPCIIINSKLQKVSKIIFNTPSHIMRGINSNNIKISGQQTIMFTKYSTDTLNGFSYFVISYTDISNKLRKIFTSFKIYGNLQTFLFLQACKYHLGAKSLSLSYATWTNATAYKIGVTDPILLKKIFYSKQFPLYVGKINKKIGKQDSSKILNAKNYLNQNLNIYTDNEFEIKPLFEASPKIKQKQKNHEQNVTNFICFFKKQKFQIANKNYCPGLLIITYRNLEQIQKILKRQDQITQINQKSFLDQLEQMYTLKIKQGQQIEAQGYIKQVIHILDDSNLINSPDFNVLFKKINQILTQKQTKIKQQNSQNFQNSKISHLFYGYGIKNQNVSHEQLSEMFLRSNIFYSMMAKQFKFFPNIFNIHSLYWKTKVETFIKFDKILEHIKNAQLNLYQPGLQLVLNSKTQISTYTKVKQNNFIQNILNQQDQYKKIKDIIPYKIESYNIKLKQQLKQQTQNSKNCKSFNPKIIFLGTKSKSPSDLRNTSGILLQINHPKNKRTKTLILLDCGNNTYDQFLLHYSPQILDKKLQSLKVIFITHLHADHSLGILDLICKRNKLMKTNKKQQTIQNSLYLIIPSNMISWFHYYCQFVYDLTQYCVVLFSQELANEQITIYDKFYQTHQNKKIIYKQTFSRMENKKVFGKNKKQVKKQENDQKQFLNKQFFQSIQENCSKKQLDSIYYEDMYIDQNKSGIVDLLRKYMFKQKTIKQFFEVFLQKYQIKKFLPTKVYHCPMSYGIIIQHQSGVKISYSGDCRPTQSFIKQAEQSALMIHQATFPSFSQDDAKLLAHSTFTQAIEAGIQSKSQKICLTHFKSENFNIQSSQKISPKYFSQKSLNYYMKNGIIACDHLEFYLSQMEKVGQVSRLVGYLGQQYMKNQQ